MKRFGYPEFDENGVRTLSTYDNEYSHMLMDIRVYRMKAGDKKNFSREGEEVAVLLLKGKVTICAGELSMTCSRESVFTEKPYAAHVCGGDTLTVESLEDNTEVLVH